MDRYILTCPGRKAYKHKGFELFINDGKPYEHSWHKCAKGHAVLLGCGDGPVLIAEDDVMFPPDFENRINKLATILPDPGVGMGYVCIDLGLRVEKAPVQYPPGIHGWGTQLTLFSPRARKIALSAINAFLLADIATVSCDNSMPSESRPNPTEDGAQNGFDVIMYHMFDWLKVPVYQFPCCQHMCLTSTCHSAPHVSPFFPHPKVIHKVEGWW